MRCLARGAVAAVAPARRVQGLPQRAARLPHVRRIRHARREALPRAHGRGSARQDEGQLLRSLQAEARRVRRADRRGRRGARRARRIVREEVTTFEQFEKSFAAYVLTILLVSAAALAMLAIVLGYAAFLAWIFARVFPMATASMTAHPAFAIVVTTLIMASAVAAVAYAIKDTQTTRPINSAALSCAVVVTVLVGVARLLHFGALLDCARFGAPAAVASAALAVWVLGRRRRSAAPPTG